jgi:hypothetical protein
MRAWTVDADDIRVAEDFDEALLHRTPEIDAFLNLELVRTPSLWRTTPVPGPGGDERLNVKKGMEPDLWVRLYRLEF